MPFDTSVFINCPFDDEYLPLLRPILFCVSDLGFEPRIALERLNSAEPRVDKILELIAASKYAIHDLSRLKAERKGQFFRLNMPFELGLDVGCRIFGNGRFAEKRCLIPEAERYRYQAAISDLSNSDIAVHANNPLTVLTEVRHWLAGEAGIRAPGPSTLWGRFTDFMADNYDALTARGFSPRDIENLPIRELLPCIREWISAHPPS
ncbi:hypothetical protein STAQ_06510 [Allostella sp. ATCC 35155]|nr:hypothetical protein STAQ_06510 [Stella sp. ATCC 35155]